VPAVPGRPLGSRNKLTEDFLGDWHAAWLAHGNKALNRVIAGAARSVLSVRKHQICGCSDNARGKICEQRIFPGASVAVTIVALRLAASDIWRLLLLRHR
jgi:hypothetical protein